MINNNYSPIGVCRQYIVTVHAATDGSVNLNFWFKLWSTERKHPNKVILKN